MKKFFLLAVSASLLATSCEKDDNGHKLDLPESYLYATIMSVDQATAFADEESDETVEHDIYFLLDNQEMFVVTENVSKVDYEDIAVGERVIAGVTLSEISDESYNYTAKLYDVKSVIVGENAVVTTEEESEAIADHKFSDIAEKITLENGYLNLLVAVDSEKVGDIQFYLVDNQIESVEKEGESYLNLELRYDSAGEDGKGTSYEKYVSFEMESYRDQLVDMDGVSLRIKNAKDEITSIEVKIDPASDLFPSVDEE
ncbi:MAG: NigD-like C-terminal domain-containing protein [Rikenellaceae bacterium]